MASKSKQKLKLSLRTLHLVKGLERAFDEELSSLFADARTRQRDRHRTLRLDIELHGQMRSGEYTGDLDVHFYVKSRRPSPASVGNSRLDFSANLDGELSQDDPTGSEKRSP